MAISCRRLGINSLTASPILVQGNGTGFTFKNITGTLQDPLPVILKNEDAAITIYVGGPDLVLVSNGQSIPPGGTLPMALYGPSEIPYVIAASGTPVISVLVGRQ